MLVGIVGAEAAKFTHDTESAARELIRSLISPGDTVISGGCHLGGIDLWAKEEALNQGAQIIEYLPACRSWDLGYRPRNIRIATRSDIVYCIAVVSYPAGYTGMRFDRCYHCNTTDHIKSGGCWTVKEAIRLGKPGIILTV